MDEAPPKTTKDEGLILTKKCRVGGPVRCVSFSPQHEDTSSAYNYIFFGLGPFLKRIQEDGTSEELLVFPPDVGGFIHGISYLKKTTDEATISWDAVVYGGKQISFCKIQKPSLPMQRLNIDAGKDIQKSMTLNDWIWDIQCCLQGDKDHSVSFLVGLAMHKIEVFQVAPNISKKDVLSVKRQYCIDGNPSCLVTSMNILQRGPISWVASGTAFQEIRIWSFEREKFLDNGSQSSGKQYCLAGHAGIIHCVRFSEDGRSLVSTSDDRSVRLWHYDLAADRWQNSWVGWGHTSRVWSAAFGEGVIVSVAEDCQTRIWDLESGGNLNIIQHACALWSVDILRNHFVVGSTGGNISLYELPKKIPGSTLKNILLLPVPDDRQQVTKDGQKGEIEDNAVETVPAKKKKKGAAKITGQVLVGLKWKDESTIVVATRSGSLFTLNVQTREWKTIANWWDESVRSTYGIEATDGCCMATHGHHITIGTSKGDILLYMSILSANSEKPMLMRGRPFKAVQDIQWLDESSIVTFHVKTVALWSLQMATNGNLTVLEPEWVLKIKTKGIPISCDYDRASGTVVVGDTRGNLSLFNISQDTSGAETSFVEAASTLNRAHQKMHVTSIFIDGDRVLSAGNDGCVCTSFRDRMSLKKGWSLPVASMTGIVKVWLSGSKGKCSSKKTQSTMLFVAGYVGNIFRIVEANSGHEFFHVDTGGRQQINHFRFDMSDGGWPSSCQSVVSKSQKDGGNILAIDIEKQGMRAAIFDAGAFLHGETIFDSCFFRIDGSTDAPGSSSPKSATFLLTGSEDCGSRISACDESGNKILDSLSLTPQSSSVRSVCASQVDECSALMAIGGSKLTLQFFVVQPRPNLTSIQGADGPLRTQDLMISYLGQGINKKTATLDHRVNAVCGMPLLQVSGESSSREHLVIAGDSDGFCHLSIVSEDLVNGLSPGVVVDTGGRPILCTDICRLRESFLIALGTTAGNVQLYQLPSTKGVLADKWASLQSTWIPLASYAGVHQMGTNTLSISIVDLSNDSETQSLDTFCKLVIWTGGDDQALVKTEQTLSYSNAPGSSEHFTVHGTVIHSRQEGASYSALKGVANLSSCSGGKRSGDDETLLVTAGYTQRLAIWKTKDLGKNTSIDMITNLPVDVGDVNCLAAIERMIVPSPSTIATTNESQKKKFTVAVCGLGVELFCVTGE